MKGDFSRATFAREKHYSGVLMQQGRVQVDADFNEQQALTRYREETETRDVIGLCGTPLDPPSFVHASGFEIVVATAAAGGPTFTIGGGRYYEDGLLVENEATCEYGLQPELPVPGTVVSALGVDVIGLAYLDVWQRQLTPLDDASMHEQALGEADTTTRVKTSWQVKVLPLAKALTAAQSTALDTFVGLNAPTDVQRHDIQATLGIACDSHFPEWNALLAPTPALGKLAAAADQPPGEEDPCLPPPGAGYTRLENQLYRVEIHEGGVLPGGAPTFKWSRENGSIVTAIEGFDGTDPSWVTVHDLGHDRDSLGFAIGDWVEVVNDHTELTTDGTQLGHLAKIVDMQEGRNAVQLSATPPAGAPASLRTLALHPRMRRWDQVARPAIPADPGPPPTAAVPGVTPTATGISFTAAHVPLEDGISVAFSNGTYRAGDYWLIPARTIVGDIEWPRNGAAPKTLEPFGVKHHFCRLALVARNTASSRIGVIADCRDAFPPLTELTSFFYLGGDGQEVMPVTTQGATTPVALPEPLQVGVARGKMPLAGSTVKFRVVSGGGLVNGLAGPVEVVTGANGIASCQWSVTSNVQEQQVEATLLDHPGGTTVHLPVTFSAGLSVAAEVRYFPPAACPNLSGSHDVQAALTQVAATRALVYVDGDGQEALPGATLLRNLEVAVVNECGPVPNQKVDFAITPTGGSGTVSPVQATTGGDGIAATTWTLDAVTESQQVEATLHDLTNAIAVPVRFDATISKASKVHYDADPDCKLLAKITTVQDAIGTIAEQVRLEYVSGDGQVVGATGTTSLSLAVRAASDCGPLAGEAIIWGGDGTFSGGAPTDANGLAKVTWTPAAWNPGAPNATQHAHATLKVLGPTADPLATIDSSATEVTFVAHLNVAADVAYEPGCAALQNLHVTTVQDGLDKLCGLLAPPAPVIHIRQVLRGDGKDLVNDADVRVDELLQPQPATNKSPVPGIVIELDKRIDPSTLAGKSTTGGPSRNSHPMCFVTAYLPWPAFKVDEDQWRGVELGFQPIVLQDAITVPSSGRTIIWAPALQTAAWLRGPVFAVLTKAGTRILMKLTLKGNFVHDNEWHFVDGEPFGPKSSVNVRPESGDGRPGGDFELWFWLRKGTTT